jgi:hypothetical protein
MGAYDLVTTVTQNLIIVFGIGLFLFFVFACLCELPHNYKGKSILAILAFVFGAVWVFSLVSYGIIKVGVVRTVYSASEYDVEQMAEEYHAKQETIEYKQNQDSNISYIAHYEGFGLSDWVYFEVEENPQAQFLLDKEG